MPWGRYPAQPERRENLPSSEESLPGLHHKECPQIHPAESLHATANAPLHQRSAMIHVKNTHSSLSKHRDKPRSDRGSKDKESSKSLWKHAASPSQRPSSTEQAEKELHLEGPFWTFNASCQSQHSSPSRHLSETDNQASFVGPNSTSTPNKTEGGPHV